MQFVILCGLLSHVRIAIAFFVPCILKSFIIKMISEYCVTIDTDKVVPVRFPEFEINGLINLIPIPIK